MAYTFIDHTTVNGADGGTTPAINTSGASLLIMCVNSYSAATAPTVSDSKSNTWTGLTQQAEGVDNTRNRLYYATNPTVGSGHTFTISGSGVYATLCVAAFGGALLSSPFDNQNGTTATSVTSVQPGSITPSQNNSLVVSGLCTTNTGLASINSSFSITDTVSWVESVNEGGHLAYLIQTTAAAVNPTWSWTTGTSVSVTIASFKPAVAAFFGGDEGAVWYMSVERD